MQELGISRPSPAVDHGKEELIARINELLNTDFSRLVAILYRMDVSETKLRKLLQDNPGTDAGNIIAELMIERQLQKIKSRREYKQRDNNINDEEKW